VSLQSEARRRTPPTSPETLDRIRLLPALQQPDWQDHPALNDSRNALSDAEPLVDAEHVRTLRLLLAEVAAGRMQIVQAGDCAEDPAEHTYRHLGRKLDLLEALAGVMRRGTGLPVLGVGRIAGQFAKPRSSPFEVIDGVRLPSYRGPLVNAPEPTAAARTADPARLADCHRSAAAMMRLLNSPGVLNPAPLLWTSHEALVLDYELPQIRPADDGRFYLTSTHWPWIGERTRQPQGAHVALMSAVANPVSCKVGPSTTPAQVVELCGLLDLDREPGRLTLISRMGSKINEALPALVTAVRAAGHPVIWLCDPMHGNTISAPSGHKTRLVTAVRDEMVAFQRIVTESGGVAGGVHLETTPDPVTECAAGQADIGGVGHHYTTLCDPRLNPEQALTLLTDWTAVPFSRGPVAHPLPGTPIHP
jgi:3-deoxy-7-phosphoheptulonate synthase